ncbi:hypothetical protein FOXYSP1_20061 [Fusarium oxysporum f. sp. phaseoli]
MYQYTRSQMMALPSSSTTILMPNRTPTQSCVYFDQSPEKKEI